ncbi:hypothetical protein EJP77_05945 [Paenibacillus zeisoli]|uniref:Dockerin domain-containing protein n=1 Tax=Paenibacillus zeisoli TaxID=2496267 RepID=A0A3S1BCS0_9BACL|nr:cohesin domain-containing protein [Paenibacillus zeisoli]RUT36510.1 hypothetical protein EJP77_05945 [Paenibacillus zeisoli]
MKKVLSLLVLVFIISTMFATVTFADDPIEVTGVTLSLSLEEGSTAILTAAITPADAANKDVKFSSSNPSVATVTGATYDSVSGTTSVTVHAIAAGSAVITATSADGGKTAVTHVTVVSKAPAIAAIVLSADSRVKPGSSFNVAVGLNKLSQSVYAQDITLTYDSNLFEYVSAAGASDYIQIVTEDKATAGKVRLVTANIGGITGASAQVLDLSFKVKPGARNTTGTIAVTEAKLGVAPEGTVIQAAPASKSITIGDVDQPVVDKTALTAAITNAQNLYDGAVVGTLPGQYPKEAKDALGAAIKAATAVQDNQSAAQSQVDSATAALGSAVDTFKAAVIREVSADLNKDGSINVGDLAIVAYHYGKDSVGSDWTAAKIADMNSDNKIDITDLAYIASKILE